MIETIVKIDGMMCGMCESHICDHIRKNFNVKKVSASHSKGQAVILSDEAIPTELLRGKISETGYTVKAPVNGYDESDDTEAGARTVLLAKQEWIACPKK